MRQTIKREMPTFVTQMLVKSNIKSLPVNQNLVLLEPEHKENILHISTTISEFNQCLWNTSSKMMLNDYIRIKFER